MKTYKSTLFFIALLSLVTLISHKSAAAVGDLVFSSNTSTHIGHFETDPIRNWIYAADETQGSVRIVDLVSKNELDPIIFNETVYDIALDPSGNFLWVVTDSVSPSVYVVDISLRHIERVITLPEVGHEIEIGNHFAYISTNRSYNGIMRVDLSSEQYVDSFTGGLFTYYKALLEISPDKTRLFVANRGISPLTLGVFDVSGENPELLTESNRDLGSNGQSLAIDPVNGEFVSIAAGGGNTSGYDTYVLNSNNLSVLSTLDTGPFPRAVAYHPDGHQVITAHTPNVLHQWEIETGNLLDSVTIDGEARAMAISTYGDFIAVSDRFTRFNIYQIGTQQVPNPQLLGHVTGAGIHQITCINHSSSQTITTNLENTGSWDCTKQGLTVNPGDEVEARLQMNIDH